MTEIEIVFLVCIRRPLTVGFAELNGRGALAQRSVAEAQRSRLCAFCDECPECTERVTWCHQSRFQEE